MGLAIFAGMTTVRAKAPSPFIAARSGWLYVVASDYDWIIA